jgi:hypothetical protein
VDHRRLRARRRRHAWCALARQARRAGVGDGRQEGRFRRLAGRAHRRERGRSDRRRGRARRGPGGRPESRRSAQPLHDYRRSSPLALPLRPSWGRSGRRAGR